MPKVNLIYYKNLLDRMFLRFFDLYNDDFRNVDGQYVLAKSMSKAKLMKIFTALLADELKSIVVPFDILNPQYFIVIGACMPNDNILLSFKQNFPKKLETILKQEFQYKYFIREKDITIDVIKFNEVCIDLFNKLFKNGICKINGFEDGYSNVVFIQHKWLDCYSMFKTIKYIIGKPNCVNLYQKMFKNSRSPIIAVNDLIDMYSSKSELNKCKKFIIAVDEVKTFLNERLGIHG